MYFLQDNITNGYNIDIINILSILSIISGILVISTKNPIVSVLFLITLFFNVACFLIILGLNFIGLSYLLVYVGAVSILFLFILMLINIRISELLNTTKNSIPLIFLVFILLSFILLKVLPLSKGFSFIEGENFDSNYNQIYLSINNDNLLDTVYSNVFTDNINSASSYLWEGNIVEFNPITSMGSIMFTSYPMWLIITSLILLLAMVGVIVITINTSEDSNTINATQNITIYNK
jgi:NADH-ubiquinone oxidoreductase chain 6